MALAHLRPSLLPVLTRESGPWLRDPGSTWVTFARVSVPALLPVPGPQNFRGFVRSAEGVAYLHTTRDIFLRLVLKLLYDGLQNILLQSCWVCLWRCHRRGRGVRILCARCVPTILCSIFRLVRRYGLLGDGDSRKASGDGFQSLLLLCHDKNDTARMPDKVWLNCWLRTR